MKSYKNIALAFVALGVFAFSSCDKENIGPVHSPNGVEASFSFEELSTSVPATDPTAHIPLYRGNTKGAASVVVSLSCSDASLNIPSSVTVNFDDGSAEGDLAIPVAGIADEIKIGAVIPDDAVSLGGVQAAAIYVSPIFSWNKIGTGTYTYTAYMEGDDPGLDIYVREDNPTIYKITSWFYGTDLQFVWDQSDNSVYVKDSFTGYTSQYGKINVIEASEFYGDQVPASYYDPSTRTFVFCVTYYDPDPYPYGPGIETFVLD